MYGCEINGKVHRGEKEKVQWKTKSKSRRNQEKDAQRADLKRTVCGDRGYHGSRWGSVVTKDLPANVVAVGNPCRVLREINEHDREYYFKDHKIPEELLK